MKRKKKPFPVKSALLLTASALLLIGSTVGSTRAALTYYSENYSAQMNMSNIGVSLLENGEEVENDGKLLEDLLGKDKKIVPCKEYPEVLSVKNSGDIDTFVRVIITKSWKNKDGVKDRTLSPELIKVNLQDNGWIVDTKAATEERMVLYYPTALTANSDAVPVTKSIEIDGEIAQHMRIVEDGNTIRYEYKYDGYTFSIDAEVDAVQTHNAEDAIKSAWGVSVNVNEDETKIEGLQ